jgi:hypothetical protein
VNFPIAAPFLQHFYLRLFVLGAAGCIEPIGLLGPLYSNAFMSAVCGSGYRNGCRDCPGIAVGEASSLGNRYAFALGRADTPPCHRRKWLCSSGIRSLIQPAKSIATRAVMSAIEY